MQHEKWLPVCGFEGLYEVSSFGRVRSLARPYCTGKIRTPTNEHFGYFRIDLWKNSKRTPKKIHRIVAETFLPNPLHKREVNHKNGIKADNRVENLEWATSSENKLHAYRLGL